MRSAILNRDIWNRCTPGAEPTVEVVAQENEHIMKGVLKLDGDCIPIDRGVPNFVVRDLKAAGSVVEEPQVDETAADTDDARDRTVGTFSDKWQRFTSYGHEPQHQEFLMEWYCKKLGVTDIEALKEFYRQHNCILEVGPGSGFNTRFMAEHVGDCVFAADISAAAHTTFENTRDLENCHVVQADLMNLPFAEESFDFIIADGVLHHTPDTHEAVKALYRKLRPGGQFFFYIYKKMGQARQFCDRYIREHFSQLPAEACYKACEGLTELGRELSRLDASITLEKGIPILGIPPGTHNVQRLLYYNFVKCFWNEAFDYETNNMVNFDWYHPVLASQHTEDEVRGWLEELNVSQYEFHPANPNGLSVLLRKPAKAA